MSKRRDARWLALLVVGLLALGLTGFGTSFVSAEGGAPGDTDPFTLVVVPDTQKYALSPTLHQTIGAQTQWIVDRRNDLNVKFAVQVGDLVENWNNATEWGRVSGHFQTLDTAALPYAVLSGNHDMSQTGLAPRFGEYFGPSRFVNAAWNSESVRYGGYLGDNQFGPDPVDRFNQNNYALLTAGGMDLLLLQLEFESPAYSLAWAQKVIDAHPNRRVIVSTHGFIHTGGNRSNTVLRTDGKSANQVWDELIYPNCNVFMVLNGHWHDGDIGEARRTDANACGTPVHQILTNYQSRANGGNGWLRYYTFVPDQNRIEAYTYSPTLGTFEQDASSRFDLDYDMSGTRLEVPLRGGDTWRYRYSAGTWPSGWAAPGFNDSAWAQGRASLGFGTPARATVVDVPPPTSNRPLSMLFRKTFTVDNPAELSQVRVITRADDGISVRVNGQEIGRRNLPTGTISHATYATLAPRTHDATGTPTVFDVPDGLLVNGQNVIAVSTHLNYTATPDISFDATITAIREGDGGPVVPAAPVVSGGVEGNSAVVSWSPGDGAALSGFEVFRDGVRVAQPGPAVREYVDSSVVPGEQYQYGVVAVGAGGLRSEVATTVVQVPGGGPGVPEDVVLVAEGVQWRWLFSSSAWPSGWTGVGFGDGSWSSGLAPLGWGHASIATNIDVPPPTSNRPRTALFRRSFSVVRPGELSSVRVVTRADDGVAVWVNGTEVGRAGLPSGALSNQTYAVAAPRTPAAIAAPVSFDVPVSLLREGENVIAVSVHHNYRGTPDISFDATITAVRTPVGGPVVPAAPVVSGGVEGGSAVVSWSPGDGAALSGFEVFRDGVRVAQPGPAVREYVDSSVVPGEQYQYGVVAVGAGGLRSEVATTVVQVPGGGPGVPEDVVLVAEGVQWRWLFSSSAWPSGWTGVGFGDGSWSSGLAPLGWGHASIATNIDVPPPTSNRPRTALFRRSFSVVRPGELSSVRVVTRADDGVAVWVNGTEVGRAGLPSGALSNQTYAVAAPRTPAAIAAPVSFDVPVSLLREGENVIAVSVHHNYRGTPDISFDATITAVRTPAG